MRLTRWIALVAVVVAAGAAIGRSFGGVMEGLSPDYPVLASDFMALGMKLGLVAGTMLAACQGIGERRPPSFGRTVRSIGLLAGVTLVCLVLILALLSIDEVRGLYATHILDIQLDRLVNPGRYVLYRGLQQGVIVGALIGSVVGGVYLWWGREAGARGPG